MFAHGLDKLTETMLFVGKLNVLAWSRIYTKVNFAPVTKKRYC
jgi:hypothetical protein